GERAPEDTAEQSHLPRYVVEGEEAPLRDPRSTDPNAAGRTGESDAGFVQLFVNVGRREGVLASDLQALWMRRGLTGSDVGRIRVRDRMSFVSVKKAAFDEAVSALSGQVLGGRTVVAELARGRG